MDNTRLPKHALNYKPRGRRDRGRPRKRWQSVDAGTGQTTLPIEEDDDDEYGKLRKIMKTTDLGEERTQLLHCHSQNNISYPCSEQWLLNVVPILRDIIPVVLKYAKERRNSVRHNCLYVLNLLLG